MSLPSAPAASSAEPDAASAPEQEEELVALTEVGRLLKAGMDAHRSRRFEEAARAYEAVLNEEPHNPDGLHLYGMLLAQGGQMERGHALLLQAVSENPTEPMFHNNLGNVLTELNRHDEAEAAYRQAVALDPKRYDALNNLAVLLRRKGDAEGAEKTYLDLLKAVPGFSDARQNLAQLYLGLGRLNDAVQQCMQGLVTAPRNRGIRHVLGLSYSTLGWHDEAVELYRKWVEDEPDNVVAAHHYAAHSGKNVPDQASAPYVRHTFDGFATSFDDKLAKLEYQAPALVGAAVATTLGPADGSLCVADAGCGTGLCASYLVPYARYLIGVDLSRGMLDQAAKRQLYHELVQGDLTEFLSARPDNFDLLVSADTLCYFGKLEGFAAAARQSLSSCGLLVFTVEAHEAVEGAPEWRLQGHGRYSHRRDYVESVLAGAGFEPPLIEAVVLRQEYQKPVHGWLVQAKTR